MAPQAAPYTQHQTQVPVTIENLYAMAGHWHGGQAHKVDTDPCPRCGSNQFFSRINGKTRGPEPAPHCYNCGYNGMFDQGMASSWGA